MILETITGLQSLRVLEENELKYSKISIIARRVLQHPYHQNVFSPLPAYLLISQETDYQVTLSTASFLLNKNSIPRDIKKDATENDFANVIGT